MSASSRLLVVGGAPAKSVAQQLARRGHLTSLVPSSQRIDAVVVTGPEKAARAALKSLEEFPSLAGVPVVGFGTGALRTAIEKLRVDGVAGTVPDLERQLAASVLARHQQRRSTALLQLAQVMTSTLDAQPLAAAVLERIEAELPVTASLLMLQEPGGTATRLQRNGAPTRIEVAATRVLQQALATRQVVTDAQTLVQPLSAHDTPVGALWLTASQPLDAAEREWLTVVAGLLGPVLRNVRQYASAAQTQRSLEGAYVERYRDLIQTNERLKKSDQLKDELLGIASHDVRSPLQVMIGHARILLDGERLSSEQRYSVEMVLKMSRKVLELMESLLEKSGEGGKLQLSEPRRFDVSELCKQTVAEMQVLARQKNVFLKAETPESAHADGDVLKLRQVIQNLVGNALEHANHVSEVTVRAQRQTRPDGDVVRVTIEDDGQGLPAEWLPVLFDRFRSPSKGRGLHISREMVELHGGEIWAENMPGHGARMVFTVPVLRERQLNASSATPVVLVVDDDTSWREVVSMALSPHYQVEKAVDGEDGFARAKALKPALIVSDTFMPRMDGMQLFAKLKGDADTSTIPVVMMSGESSVLPQLQELGAAAALGKPFDLPRFVHLIDELIRRSSSAMPQVGNDPETGLFDHLGIVNRLGHELSRSVRYERPLSVAVLRPDLAVRAEELPAVAAIVARILRMPDLVAHLGQGTFVAVLPETTEAGARSLLARVVAALREGHGGWRSNSADASSWRESAAALLERLLA